MSRKGWKLNTVTKKLNDKIGEVRENATTGLIQAAILIRQDMEKSEPKIPIDTGNLRASWFTSVTNGKGQVETAGGGGDPDFPKIASVAQSILTTKPNPALLMGFSANYAIFVHENAEAQFQRPGSGPFFFKAAMLRNSAKIIQIMAKYNKL